MLDNYQDLIDELLGAPTLIRNAVAAHGGEAPDAVIGLITLLTERDAIVLERLNRMRREANPHLRALAPLDEAEPRVTDQPLETVLKTFDANRGELVSLLMNLTLKDWERVATHEIEGEVTIADEVELHVESDEAVRARIEATLG